MDITYQSLNKISTMNFRSKNHLIQMSQKVLQTWFTFLAFPQLNSFIFQCSVLNSTWTRLFPHLSANTKVGFTQENYLGNALLQHPVFSKSCKQYTLFALSSSEKYFSSQNTCPPVWNGASCSPPTAESDVAVFPCMTLYNCKLYDVQGEIRRKETNNQLSSTNH